MCCDFWKRWQPSNLDNPAQTSMEFEHRWSSYYKVVEGRPPRETLMKALELFATEAPREINRNRHFAVDLGCGNGRDTAELLRQNWRVLAIDGQIEAIEQLRQRKDLNRTYLEARVQTFEDLTLPPEIDLINASFCLPFCPAEHFSELWDVIVSSLKTGGRFSGQLFGDRDSWASLSNIVTQTRAEVEQLLAPFKIEFFEEESHPGKTALGEDKYWHIYQIVARKTGA
jgi:tellurite methyltransferase